jgi:diguanylate cyclase (GGDEF)-like protein/PAS domain S-box-containing protein
MPDGGMVGHWPRQPAPARYHGLLPRLRRSFALFTGVAALGGLTQLGLVDVGDRMLAVASLLGLCAWALAMAGTRGPWWLDVLAVLPLSGIAIAVADWWAVLPLIHVVVFQRSLYGGIGRAYGGAVALTLVPLGLAVTVGGATVHWSSLALPPSVLVSTWLLRQVRLLAERVELGARREQRLLRASQRIADGDREAVDREVVTAALELLEQPGARSTLWEQQGDTWVAVASTGPSRLDSLPRSRLPQDMIGRAAVGEPWVLCPPEAAILQERMGLEPTHQGFIFVPLPRPHGPVTVLGLSCPRPSDDALVDVLRRFVQEVALAEDRARLIAEVADREARLGSILEGSADIIAQLDAEGRFTMINQAATRVHGYEPDELIGRSVFDLIVEQDRGHVLRTTLAGDLSAGVWLSHRIYNAAGEVCEVESRISRPHASSDEFILNARDVTDRKALEAEIVYRASHDPLTGLANRSAFNDRLEEALSRARRSGTPVGLLMLDLDDFKPVNDTHGHHAGDVVLVEVASRLREGIRATDLAARMGGDEFSIILEDAGDADEIAALAQRLEAALAEPVTLPSGDRVRVTASMGLAGSRTDGDADELLREADQHLYARKRARSESSENPRTPATTL